MITLILLPFFILFTYLFYNKAKANVEAGLPILKDNDINLLGATTILFVTLLIAFIIIL